jgi:hypothetical protein
MLMKAGIALTALIVIAAAAMQPAVARAPKPSAVTIDNYHGEDGTLFFPGHVESSKKCERNRKVTVHTTGPGAEGKIGSDETNSKGKFRVSDPSPVPGTDAHAEVKRVEIGNVTCGSDKSPSISLAG